jgi:pimeloyl-ACP methyl ester carboxylesterase
VSDLRRRRLTPVLVLPGYGAGDLSTAALRGRIAALGHPVHRWRLGRNDGPTPGIIAGMGSRFDEIASRHGRPVSLVGWSLGGVYAWFLAQQAPDKVAQVITLGSPLRSATAGLGPLGVPATSIWSRADRVVPWRDSRIDAGDRSENIEVRATHLTLGFDPFVSIAIADRLGHAGDRWRPFRPPWWLAGAFPPPVAVPADA